MRKFQWMAGLVGIWSEIDNIAFDLHGPYRAVGTVAVWDWSKDGTRLVAKPRDDIAARGSRFPENVAVPTLHGVGEQPIRLQRAAGPDIAWLRLGRQESQRPACLERLQIANMAIILPVFRKNLKDSPGLR